MRTIIAITATALLIGTAAFADYNDCGCNYKRSSDVRWCGRLSQDEQARCLSAANNVASHCLQQCRAATQSNGPATR